MSTPLSYNETYKEIKEACDVNKLFLDVTIKQCQAFIQSNQNFLKTLSKISFELTDKRSSGIRKLSSSIKGPSEFKNSENNFKNLWNTVTEKVFNHPPGLATEVSLLQVHFIEKLIEIKKNYESQAKNMIQMGDYCENMMKNAKSDLDKAMSKYNTLCKDRDSVIKSLKTSEDPKLKSKQESLEKQISELEKQCSELQSNFNETQAAWAQNMEDVLTKFELLDKTLNIQIADIFINFSPQVADIKADRDRIVAFLSTVVDEEKMIADINNVLCQKEMKEADPVVVEPNIVPLSFDAAAYLGSEAFDGEEMRIVTTAKEDYVAQKSDEMSVKKDDLIIVHHTESDRHFAKDRTKSGYVPINNFKALHCTFKPHIMQFVQDYNGTQKFAAGEKVFVRNIIGKDAHVLTGTYDEVIVPADLLL